MFEKALDVYASSPHLLQNEIARTTYKKGCTLFDMGRKELGLEDIKAAESIRQSIIAAEDWAPATGEADFDEIVQFWTR